MKKINSNDSVIAKGINDKKLQWHYLLLIPFIVFIMMGLFYYFKEETTISHFNDFSVKPISNTTLQPQIAIIGEYKQTGKDSLSVIEYQYTQFCYSITKSINK